MDIGTGIDGEADGEVFNSHNHDCLHDLKRGRLPIHE